jgi:hypothetical protein
MKIENGILQVTKAEIIDILYNDLNHVPEADCYRINMVEAIIKGSFLNAKNIQWLKEKLNYIITANDNYRESLHLPDTPITGFITL